MNTNNQETIQISLDMESVLADTHGYLVRTHNERHDTDYSTEHITEWSWVIDEIGWNKFNKIIERGWYAQDINPLEPDLAQNVATLTNTENITVDIVTGRIGCEKPMKQWLAEQDIPYNEFRSHNGTKAELQYDFYIDDKPKLATKLDSNQMQYMIEKPYNATIAHIPNVIPTPSVSDAVYHLAKME